MRTKHACLVLAVLVLAMASGSSLSAATGSAYFNYPVNWQQTPALYFSIAGGPPNTCGDLWSSRNGKPWTEGVNWICTDSSGNATKGPWTWANQSGDENSLHYIEWPNGTYTNTASHIWDKTAPIAQINSGGANNGAPTQFYGYAIDSQFGAGFDANWAQCKARFRDLTTQRYWSPDPGSYSTSSPVDVNCSFGSMPSTFTNWTALSLPAQSTHVLTHCYRWEVSVYDGGMWGSSTMSFCL